MDFDRNPASGCSPAFDLGPYIGAVLLGTLVSLALWGASLLDAESSFISPFGRIGIATMQLCVGVS